MAVGLYTLEGLQFDPHKPHTYCRLCGAIFQRTEDRIASTQQELLEATLTRRDWSFRHAHTHHYYEHKQLALSGRWVTPEAANKLAPYGIIPISDLVLDSEVASALAEAPAVPITDSEY